MNSNTGFQLGQPMRSAFFPTPAVEAEQQQAQDEPPGRASGSSKRAAATHIGSPSRPTAPGSISRSTTSSTRALRFPSSRRYLWDRTAAGPQVLVDVLECLPHVQVAASTFGAIARASSSGAGSVTLQLGLSVSSSNQVAALIEEHDPLGARGALQLSCTLSPPGAAAAAAAGSDRRASMQAQVDQRDIARVQQLYVLSASATAAASPAEPTKLVLQLLMPRAGLLATPLYTKRLCHVPLAEALLKPGCMAAGQTGYLSMDQARSLLPLEATDANVYSTPLVGVWVKGPSSVLHPLVVAACLRFAFSSLLMDRAVNPEDGGFLLLLCPEGDPVSKCFEVSMTDSSKLELCCYRAEAAARPAGGSNQFPGGVLSATWVPERCQEQPLPGTLTARGSSTPLLQAGPATGSRHLNAAGTPARSAAGYFSNRAVQGHSPLAADSPVLSGRGHSASSRAGGPALGRSSAPSAAFGYGTAAQTQHGSAAARRSLPLTRYAEGSGLGWQGAASATAGELQQQALAAGLTPWGADEPQPRTGVPAVPYMPGMGAQGSMGQRQPWQQQQQQEEEQYAAVPAPAGEGGSGGACTSPSKGSRQQQLTWSDRQDQVLRRSLQGAAEALRSSQASLAAAREAASGAGSRLGSPTKAHAAAAAAAVEAPVPSAPPAPWAAAGAGTQQQGLWDGSAAGSGAAELGAAAGGSPQPGLSRLHYEHHAQQQQQRSQLGEDAELDCGPRMGSPVRMSVQRKASMLAAAAAHAAGVASPAAATGAAGGSGQQDSGDERPVSPAVQAGVALSNLSLLQHLSSGQLLQQGGERGLEAVGHAAVAAAAGGSPMAAGRSGAAEVQQADNQHGAQCEGGGEHIAPRASPASSARAAATGHHPDAGAAAAAVAGSVSASHAAAAAIQAANSSMQRVPAHPYGSQSLGVQRYAADTAVMHASSHGSPGGMGLLSPGSSPGMYGSQHTAQWTPLQQHQQPRLHHQQPGAAARVPAAWSPGAAAALASPGAAGLAGRGGSLDWQQQQQQQQYPARQQLQQVLPVSVGVSPGSWVPDPVAQALQGEVDRLRQQLQQLQHQLKLAGMALPNAEAEAASGTATPEATAPPAGALPPPAGTPSAAAAAAAAGSPIHVHNVYPVHVNVWMPGKQQQAADGAYASSGGAQEEWEVHRHVLSPGAPQTMQQLHWPPHRYPAVSYAGSPTAAVAAAAAADNGAAAADAGVRAADAVSSGQPGVAEGAAAGGSSTHAGMGDSGSAAVCARAPAAAAAAGAAEEAQQHGTAPPAGDVPTPAPVQEQQQEGKPAEAEDNAAILLQQQQAAASAARQRRRKLDFNAAAAAAGAAAEERSGAADSSNSDAEHASGAPEAGADSAGSGGESAPPAIAAASHADGSKGAIPEPAPCSSPGARVTAAAPASEAPLAAPAGAAESPAAPAAPAGVALRSSAASSCYGGVRLSTARSSGVGLGRLRASLDAPALVEVVRARVVDLSEDSDSEEWEDRLLVKYGLK